jgi:dihydroorotate dehydrogenase
MPDWSYHPLLRPALFHLPAETGRDLTLGAVGKLAALPLGARFIHLLGHMHPPASVRCSALDMAFISPVGLGAGIDTHAVAPAALSHFGFGFLEVGPVTLNPIQSDAKMQRQLETQAIIYPDLPVNHGVAKLVARLQKYGTLKIPLAIRLGYQPGSNAIQAAQEGQQLIEQLAPYASFFVLDCQPEVADGLWSHADWDAHLTLLSNVTSRPILINFRPDMPLTDIHPLVTIALDHGISGIVIGGGIRTESNQRLLGMPARASSLRLLRQLHAHYGTAVTIIASGAIQQPQDALDFLEAGAALVQLDSGFVYAGPGLPKRINEAIAYYRPTQPVTQQPASVTVPAASWFWSLLLGLALIISALVIFLVAVTRTVLPYDEAFVGLSRDAMIAINPRLLPFLAHDRVSLAGTMLSTGILYSGLAWGGIRAGRRWALNAISISAVTGFISFFLFLGYGYFDPLHALLTASLIPLWVMSLRSRLVSQGFSPPPNLTNNRNWLQAQWGQLTFIAIGFGLIMGGLTITTVGIVNVFVPEDLQYMDTTAAILNAANSRLLPLIAHDRVGFGGNLISVGLAVLLLSLWGFRQGERWVWWTLALGGVPGFIAAVGIHLSVGYLNLLHLLPVLVALLLFTIALIFSFPYLHHPDTKIRPLETQKIFDF